VTIGVIGGLLGLVVAQLFINGLIGPFLEDSMGGIFPHFKIPPELALLSLAIAAGLAIVAAILPAYQASKLSVADALRTVE
jgi:putative ABC transport system permease protein